MQDLNVWNKTTRYLRAIGNMTREVVSEISERIFVAMIGVSWQLGFVQQHRCRIYFGVFNFQSRPEQHLSQILFSNLSQSLKKNIGLAPRMVYDLFCTSFPIHCSSNIIPTEWTEINFPCRNSNPRPSSQFQKLCCAKKELWWLDQW